MLRKIALALACATALALLSASVESSLVQSNPNLDCSPYRGESTC
jgi:hypothetical protein